MRHTRRNIHEALLALAVVALLGLTGGQAAAASAVDLDNGAQRALATLYKANPTAEVIGGRAKATLILPKIVKAGLIFGGSYGEGVLMKGSTVSEYDNSVSASGPKIGRIKR